MVEKRPIDVRRESAGSILVGSPDDPIKLACEITGALFVIKERSIYVIKLADQIDPERTNERIPNVQQKVLNVGASSELVARSLLTARQLFIPAYISPSVDHKRALALAFEYLKDLAAMDEVRRALGAACKREEDTFRERTAHGGGLLLPSVEDIESKCESFTQKADHALVSLLDIAKLFYGKDAGRKWFEGLAELAEARYGKDSGTAQYLLHVLPFCKAVRAIRNCIEHPKEAERISIKDYTMSPRGDVVPPTIEVIHPQSAHPPVTVAIYFDSVVDGLLSVFEGVIAHLCANNMRKEKFGPLPISVVSLPPEQRAPYNGIRYCWGFFQGDRVVVAS